MKKTYQSCGKIDVASKTATVFTYLPDLNINFRFTNFYNISTNTHYGIVGILVNEGENVDLSDSIAELSQIPGKIDLKNLDFRFSRFDFKELNDQDEISFFCFHDDQFNNVNLDIQELTILKNYQDLLSLYGVQSNHIITEFIPKNTKLDDINGDGEPKKGNGGILSVNGSC